MALLLSSLLGACGGGDTPATAWSLDQAFVATRTPETTAAGTDGIKSQAFEVDAATGRGVLAFNPGVAGAAGFRTMMLR